VKETGRPDYVGRSTSRLNVSSGSTYNFTRAIVGGFNFAYYQADDNKLGLKSRGLSIEFNAQFTF
jgi:hypothetical protein